MKKQSIQLFCLAILILLLGGCEDFIERDLSKKSLTVYSPVDNVISPSFAQSFWWAELKGATEYQIQIVKPSFSNVQSFIADTIIKGSHVDWYFSPGTYQWRIRARNSTSSTEYVTRTLVIDSTMDLGGQQLVLSSPADNYYSNDLLNSFSWQMMPNADNYVFQLLQAGSIIHTESGSDLSSTYTFTSEGTYEWRIFAQNENSNSAYATRTIVVDTTSPVLPSILAPLTDTTSVNPVELSWYTSEADLTYRVLISQDSTFLSVLKDTSTAASTYNLRNILSGQYYYWKVRATDRAGNSSAYTSRRRIKLN